MIIETDASANQLGAVLLQVDEEGVEKPVGYYSRQCNSAECNYSPTEREALVILWAVKMLRPYIERTRFTIRSDHAELGGCLLRTLHNLTTLVSCVGGWLLHRTTFRSSTSLVPRTASLTTSRE